VQRKEIIMKTVKGDLIKLTLEGNFDIIVHGCNCFCTMGAGIAKSIKAEFPESFMADQKTEKGDRSKLGSYTQATTIRHCHSITVINAYTQFNYRGKGIKADYDAIRRVFKKLKTEYSGKRFGLPLIGAGLAGGDWKVICGIISKELQGEDYTFVEFAP
jgi:O-acetyl-ADP-ribose deacetylase (regulator of RNase III)